VKLAAVAAAQGPQSVVFVHQRYPEHRDHRVADELLDRPAVRLDDRPHVFVVTRQHPRHSLGVSRFPERSRPDDVTENERHRLPQLATLSNIERRAAGAAEALPRRVLGTARGASDHAAPDSARNRAADATLPFCS
jgi:hypothetical protein